jgi:preprotein translocase subunit YajC
MPFFAQAAQGGSTLSLILPFALMFGVMYLMIIRPQQKKAKEHQAMVDALKKGDRVITSGGLHGSIKDVKEQTILVKVAEGTVVEVSRSAVTAITSN